MIDASQIIRWVDPRDYEALGDNFLQFSGQSISRASEHHQQANGTFLRERSLVEFSTAYLENKQYSDFVRRGLDPLPRSAPILEVGAGDGRITRYLLEMGFENIIACECNPNSLGRLHGSLSRQERERVLLLVQDLQTLTLPRQGFQAVLAIEVLCYFNHDYEMVVGKLTDFLAPGGFLLESEPLLEGALVYALAEQDWENVLSICRDSLKIESQKSGRPLRSRVFQENEIEAIHAAHGLQTLGKASTSAINSLAVSRIGQSTLADMDKLALLRAVRDRLESQLAPRCLLYLLQKL